MPCDPLTNPAAEVKDEKFMVFEGLSDEGEVEGMDGIEPLEDEGISTR